MNKCFAVFAAACAMLLFQNQSSGQSLEFELQGMSGPGITADNEPADVIDGGSGDVGSFGISVNLSTRVLSIHIVWGSGNGYQDLSSDVDIMNIHGPTESAAPNNYMESEGTLTGLTGFDPSASNGSFAGDVELSQQTLRDLLEGRFYLHLHTLVNNNGEVRGYMIPEVVVGDTNNDGLINLLDVESFVAAISSGNFVDEADINRDGIVNLLDIDPFIALLSG